MTLEDRYRWSKADVLKIHQQTQHSYRAVYQRTSTCSRQRLCCHLPLQRIFLPKYTRQKRHPSTKRVCPAASQDREPKSQGALMANLLSTSLCTSCICKGMPCTQKHKVKKKKTHLRAGRLPAGCCSPQILSRCPLHRGSQQELQRGLAGRPIHKDQPHVLCLLGCKPGFIPRNLVLELLPKRPHTSFAWP